MSYVEHVLEPVWDERSRVLILGTMPSPKSREAGFYYGHPQNRFWPTLSQILHQPLPQSKAEKRRLCLEHGIALWDVLSSCHIDGASDSSIRQERANDFSHILAHSQIRAIFTTGQAAHKFYRKHSQGRYAVPEFPLPSTSPANCQITLAQLIQAYQVVVDWL